jgi:hypothetical protein
VSETEGLALVFLPFIAAMAFGCVAIAVMATQKRRDLIIASSTIGALAGLFYGGSALREDQFPMLIGYVAAGGIAALCVALILRPGYHYLLARTSSPVAVPKPRQLVDDAASAFVSYGSALAPQNWAVAVGRPRPSVAELHKRIFVAVSAATGSVAGGLIALDVHVLQKALWELLTPFGVLQAIILTIISLALFAPLNEFVFERAAPRGGQRDGEVGALDVVLSAFRGQALWRPVARLALVWLVAALIELIYRSVDDTVRSAANSAGADTAEASKLTLQILLAATTPAVVSYYWSAALQLEAPSVRTNATSPSVFLTAILVYLPAFLSVACWFLLDLINTVHNSNLTKRQYTDSFRGAMSGLLLSPLVAIPIALAVGWIGCGIYAVAGGYALDRARGRLSMAAVFIALLLATAVHQGVADAVIWLVGGTFDSWVDATYLFFATLGWYAGLWASGFPRLVQKPDPAIV